MTGVFSRVWALLHLRRQIDGHKIELGKWAEHTDSTICLTRKSHIFQFPKFLTPFNRLRTLLQKPAKMRKRSWHIYMTLSKYERNQFLQVKVRLNNLWTFRLWRSAYKDWRHRLTDKCIATWDSLGNITFPFATKSSLFDNFWQIALQREIPEKRNFPFFSNTSSSTVYPCEWVSK